ncbi:hypothetical protein GW933_03915 [Candidatus Falkowbacteria bacterium]|uniref:Uncharacterized protein n=1 Tax=Candidatus Buchananbacteria bacterium CG10_big_fil_rev_8_21_14_0_10_33_19 TaxID=1974525 RepID=A0A2H0W5C7_9BACT|nr:hypothetical protein [Candidatus Falkowbacteria bacterium]PIS06543.1 MAG: hypothetical protein COT80_00280 [Candidatus Buchananbacteria bacterium CG10_big_fil_rev_8_21_14_0_10_33_19]
MSNTKTKELSDCTNWELMQLLVPDIEDYINNAKTNNPDLLKLIDHRSMTQPGFRPFAYLGNFH